ncbi:nascent polypeptide-associated complex protein [Candidatus Micrarchaeota archaeon]|nr:nascent polypeptide-associated complex protein [Candidatus Micrarchaeota archaeon]
MIPNMNPKQMEKMMKQMGINSKEISAKRVVIEREGEKIIIDDPQITEITMQGKTSFQMHGIVRVETAVNEDDVKMVMEQTTCTREQALEALKNSNGDIAQAIIELKKE